MEWLRELIADFDGPAWTTLVISLGALGVSGFTLWRGRTPKPHWELLKVERERFGVLETYNPQTEEFGAFADVLIATVRQNGPGAAESPVFEYRPPRGQWREVETQPAFHAARGASFDVTVLRGDLDRDHYELRVKFRCLPNTNKPKSWVVKLTTPEAPQDV
ncbi:hypothetical protein [Microbacterium paludicola]|uniref:hypothetical protein n=1 Tax=Microbacterium paludicola TaxID=300019 RepID=UPI000A839950|nr:hypothetical protein [Microbacterium paludicola]